MFRQLKTREDFKFWIFFDFGGRSTLCRGATSGLGLPLDDAAEEGRVAVLKQPPEGQRQKQVKPNCDSRTKWI